MTIIVLNLGLSPCKTEQPLPGMKLQEKKKKMIIIEEICLEKIQEKNVSINSRLQSI